VEHEQRNGHAPLDGFNSLNGQANGHGSPRVDSAGINGNGSIHFAADAKDAMPLERRFEYVDRSVGNVPVEDVSEFDRDGDLELDRDDEDDDSEPVVRKPVANGKSRIVQQVGEARRRQGLSIRCVAQRLGLTVGDVRAKEEPDADMLLSELYRWQEVLEVPLEELLADPDEELSPRVLMRARMLRVMKTARALRAQARTEGEHRLAKLLISQLIEIMPELKEVSAWPAVGHRRTADEIGKIGERPISDDFMHEAS
jgi:transcriptional regulator with XRE-family HTH domain